MHQRIILPRTVYDGVDFKEETTSPTNTAPRPTSATPPSVVDDNQGDEAAAAAARVRGLRDLGLRRNVRDEEAVTNPIDLRLRVGQQDVACSVR